LYRTLNYLWNPEVKIAIGVAYCGSGLEGWQSQPSGNTVQDHLERALSEIAGERVGVTGAGRTDAGVHACAQVAHFETSAERPESAWVRGVNSLLPESVAVQWAAPVADDFHARYSALSRNYRYVLYNHPVRPALLADRIGWFHLPLEMESMRQAARCLLGEQDFSSFRAAECQAKNPVRVMERAEIRASGPYFLFDFAANAFLHHMVRNIVGCLVDVGKGKHPPEWIAELIAARDRRFAAPTFAAAGLYLSGVRYDARWNLPAFPRMMPFDAEAER
jgi:tRNA pseudouridine38-40 synthase